MIDLRTEVNIFQPVKAFILNGLQEIEYGELFANQHCALSGEMFYNTLLAPINLSVNHYEDSQKR
ncbi:hypothetical protein [Daejeonella sp.]|jgi:hypothetical protein|uniref:hypothetical protein n=1 Tax=Daejeonella sp. TaxID=2805397 RepID=UPI0037C14FE4